MSSLKTKQELALEAIAMAEHVGVPAALVCAIIEVSSHWDASMMEWNPTRWLLGEHPVDLGGDDNWMVMGTRWGLMQVSGQEAFMMGWRELKTIPDESLEAGCRLLKRFLDVYDYDYRKALINWFGAERKWMVPAVLAILPDYQKFVEMKPCVNG